MLSSIIPLASLLVLAQAGYETYPSVAKTASINGFADKIYDQLPVCAQPCVKQSTSSTPCPYWDPGCLCVISTFASSVADCIASSCSGSDVVSAGSLATSVCSSAGVGAPYWYIDSAASSSLAAAATKAVVATTSATTAAATSVSSKSTPVAATSTLKTSNTQTTSAAVTKAASSSSSSSTSNSVAAATSQAARTSSVTTQRVSSSVSASSAPASTVPVVSTAYNAAAGVAPAAVVGLAAGLAILF